MSTIDPLSPIADPAGVTGRHPAKILAALKKLTLRKVLLKLHLYITLWLGAFLVMSGLTGSLLVYDHAIDKWLNSDTMQVEVGQQRLPLSMLIAAANQGFAPLILMVTGIIQWLKNAKRNTFTMRV